MKKKSLLLLSFIIVFTASFSYADSQIEIKKADYQELLKNLENLESSILDGGNNLDLDASLEELLEAEQEILEELEVLEELKESMNNMNPQLRAFGFTDFIEGLYKETLARLMEIREAIERQYNGKKQFIVNSRESYRLSMSINKEIKASKDELINIIKDEGRRIDTDDYRQLLLLTDNLKSELADNNYVLGQIAKTSRKYIKALTRKDFRRAMDKFDKILRLQEEKLELLRAIDRNIHELNKILSSA